MTLADCYFLDSGDDDESVQALQYVSDGLKNDKEVVMKAVNGTSSSTSSSSWTALRYASDNMKNALSLYIGIDTCVYV